VRGQQVQVPEVPEFFTKATTAVNAHEGLVPLDPRVTQKFDYEVELAIVIGKAGKNIAAADAMDHVFGFTIVNDLTGRDLQRRHGQWFKGKTLDGSCPIGPVVVAKAALPNFADLAIRMRVNGEVRQDDRTSSMVHKVPQIIESLSAGLTLEPGDIIATGTPSGVGYAMDPPQYLKNGDVVEAEVEGIGVLRNTIREV
jgi:2-keto-4-pentenoate hydratase/2-oxohepta-3-ene-1,7-dioic acid hydratase in catechol pathway